MEGMMNSSSSVDLRKEVVCFEPMSEIDAAPHANAESIEDLKTRHHRLMVWAAVALIFVFSLLAASLWKLYILQQTPLDYKLVFDKTFDISNAACSYSIHTLKLTSSFNANPIYFNISSIPSECVSQDTDSFALQPYSGAGPNRKLNSIISCFTDLFCVVDAFGNVLSLYEWATSNEQFLVFSSLALLLILAQP